MPKIIVITDERLVVLGTVRADPVPVDGGTVQFVPYPNDKHLHHELDVNEEWLRRPVDELHRHVAGRLKRRPQSTVDG
jgi:hypothetical protein